MVPVHRVSGLVLAYEWVYPAVVLHFSPEMEYNNVFALLLS